MAKRPTKPDIMFDDVNERILEMREVLERVPWHRTTLWDKVRRGEFPAPIRLGRAKLGWRLSAVLAWIRDRETNPIEPRAYFGREVDTQAESPPAATRSKGR